MTIIHYSLRIFTIETITHSFHKSVLEYPFLTILPDTSNLHEAFPFCDLIKN